MHSVFFTMFLAANLGPMGPDPAREPQMAANESIVGLTFGAGKRIYFSASHDAGKTFSIPIKVAESDIVPLNRHRGPRIALPGGTILISAVVGRTPSQEQHAHGLPSDGDLVVWRSLDGGMTWSKGTKVNDVPGAPTEGLHALAAGGKGTVFAAWLDKRGGKGIQLYGASSTDGGAKWSKNILIYHSPEGTICECCHPSVAIDSSGQFLVMWRNWLNGSRDLYLARSRDGVTFTKAERLGTGAWKLNGCPMDGGGLVVSKNRVVTAWRREGDVFLAEPGKPEIQIGTGKDVALASGEDGTHALWTNGTKIELWKDGKTQVLSDSGSFPALTSLPAGGVLAAWEENGSIVTHRVPGLEAAQESRRTQARFLAPCCWRENLAAHNSPVAEQLRTEIAGLVASGQTESQIVDEYVARYGERILREPRGTQFWILMITPIAALGIGCLLVIRFLLRRRQDDRATGAVVLSAAPEDDLEWS